MSMFGSQRTLAVAVTAKVDQYVTAMGQADRATTDFAKRVEADGKRVQRAQKTTGTTATASAREQQRAAKTATTAVEQAAAKQTALARKQETAAKRASAAHQDAWNTVGQGATAAGVALTAAVGGVVTAYARFDQQLSKVRAVSGANETQMRALSAAALQAGKDTVFSASEAAAAESELAKVGLTSTEIIGGALRGALDLAAAGSLDLATAAETAGKTMKTFGLSAKDVPAIADALASGANKSAADVSDLSQALAQTGQVAYQTGLSMTDTVGVLAAFADNALLGSDAGTSLKTMLQRLSAPTDEAAALMEKLGIDAYDTSGNFVGITTVAGQLQKSLGGLTVEQRQMALATIFGSDAVRAASVLYGLGAEGLTKYTEGVKESGAASRVAQVQTDNLIGDFERLTGALESSFLESGGAANGVLRTLTQTAAGAVETFGKLPGPVRQGGVVVALLAGATLTLGGGLLMLLPRIAATRVALTELGVTSARTRGAMIGLSKALGAFTVVSVAAGSLDAIARAGDGAALSVDRTTTALLNLAHRGDLKALDEAFQGLSNYGEDDIKGLDDALNRLADPGLNSKLNKLASTLTFGTVKSGQEPIVEQFNRIGESLSQMVDSGAAEDAAKLFSQIAERAQASGMSVDELSKLMPAYQDALARTTNAQEAAGSSAEGAAGGLNQMKGAVDETALSTETAEEKIKDFTRSLDALYGQTFGVAEAQDSFRGSLTAMGDQAKIAHGKVKGNSEATLDLRDKMRGAFRAALDVVDAYKRTGASSDEVAAKSKAVRDEFVKVATRAGISKEEIRKYADAFDQIPTEAATKITVTGVDAAIAKIAALDEKIRNIPSLQAAIYNASGVKGNGPIPKSRSTSRVRAQAEGGFIPGPPSKADTVPAMLSTGEYVITSAAVQKYGLTFFDQVNTRKYATGGLVRSEPTAVPVQRFASGGTVDMPRRWIPASAAGAPSSAAPVVIEQHNHYHLDGAAVAGTARAYAAEVDRVQASRTRNALRYGSART